MVRKRLNGLQNTKWSASLFLSFNSENESMSDINKRNNDFSHAFLY